MRFPIGTFLVIQLLITMPFQMALSKPVSPPEGITTLKDADALRKRLNLEPYLRSDLQNKLKNMTVAILDVGFGDITPENIEKQLPKGSRLITSYASGICKDKKFDLKNDSENSDFQTSPHGMHMAQTMWGLTGFFNEGPKFLLYSANSFEAFHCAVRDIIDQTKPKVVLFSANWEFTLGNFDGTGELNELVAEAVEDGVIWVNAAGNYGNLVANFPVDIQDPKNNFIRLTDGANPYLLKITNEEDDLNLKVNLSWTQNGEDRELAVRLYSEEVLKAPATTGPLVKSVPFFYENTLSKAENTKKVIGATLMANLRGRNKVNYYLGVNAERGTFSKKDNVRITLIHNKTSGSHSSNGSPLSFADKVKNSLAIMDPASGAGLTIGSAHQASAKGPTLDGRGKPEIIMGEDTCSFTDDTNFSGSSYSAAIFAASVTLLKAEAPQLKQNDLLLYRTQVNENALRQQGFIYGRQEIEDLFYRLGGYRNPAVKSLQDNLGPDNIAYRVAPTNAGQRLQLLLLKPMDGLAQFNTLPDFVQKNPRDYTFVYYVKRTPTTRTVERERRGQDQEVVVREGYYKTKTVQREVRGPDKQVPVGRRLVGVDPNLYLTPQGIGMIGWYQMEYETRATYRTVTEKQREWVPEVTRVKPTYYTETIEIPADDKLDLFLYTLDKETNKLKVIGKVEDPERDLIYMYLKDRNHKSFDPTFVTDGTENDPRFFKVPAPDAFKLSMQSLYRGMK